MPYILVDEVPDGTEEAYVVDKNEYDAAVADRDALLDRAVKAEDMYSSLQKKYAAAFLSTKPPASQTSPAADTGAHSISELFK